MEKCMKAGEIFFLKLITVEAPYFTELMFIGKQVAKWG